MQGPAGVVPCGEDWTTSPQQTGLLLPPPGYSRGGCVALATGSAMGLWEVKNCTAFRARYICRQSLGTPVTPELPGPDPTPSLTGSCPQGWGSDPKLRHCYKVGSLPAWEEGAKELHARGEGSPSRAQARSRQLGPRDNVSPQQLADRGNF